MADPLSDILALAGARCVVTGGLRAGGSWSLRFRPDATVKLDAVARGDCWLVADDGEPVRLEAGDAVVLNGARSMVLCSDPRLRPVDAPERPEGPDGPGGPEGPETPDAPGVPGVPDPVPGSFRQVGSGADVVVIGGHVEVDPAAASLFTSALPPVVHVRASSAEAAEIRRLLERIAQENAQARPGAGFAADQHAQLLLLHVLRAGIEGEALSRPGWLRLLADPRLRPAVELIHAHPARDWGLAELAAAAGMSRSHFAHRFRETSGRPALTYLAHWRVHLAARALRTTDTTVAALAERLGYASESSFSHAFTRITGTPPGRYRRTSLADRTTPAGPAAPAAHGDRTVPRPARTVARPPRSPGVEVP